MKHKDLIRKLMDNGWYFKRDGGNHEVWTNGKKPKLSPDIKR